MDKNLELDFVRITEAAAIAAAKWVGKGDKHAADDAATTTMRKLFNELDVDARVVIGEGERDEAPMLFIGEKLGTGKGTSIDIAVDPLECTDSTAYGRGNAISVLASAPKGTILHAPDTYMNKIAVGPDVGSKVSLEGGVGYNLEQIAKALDKKISEVTVMILERPRHDELVKEIRKNNARILFIPDGDVTGAIAPSIPRSGVDVLMGIGAAPEGVLAATALSCLGGYMETKLHFRIKQDEQRAQKMGVKKMYEIMKIKDMINSDKGMFSATGVTNGPFLKGVEFTKKGIFTHSIIMRAKTKTIRYIQGQHMNQKRGEKI